CNHAPSDVITYTPGECSDLKIADVHIGQVITLLQHTAPRSRPIPYVGTRQVETAFGQGMRYGIRIVNACVCMYELNSGQHGFTTALFTTKLARRGRPSKSGVTNGAFL